MSENQPVIIISGGSRGLGQAIAEDLLATGARVCTFSRSETPFIEKMRAEDPQQNRFDWQALDALNNHAVKDYVLRIYKKYRRIDGLVNNAGANLDQLLPVTRDEEIERILNLNLAAVMRLTRQVSRVMLKQNSGAIVNISSILGHRGFRGTSVYSATKAGLDGFTRALARELGKRAVRVNAVSPGFIDTDMTHHMPEGQRSQIIRRTPMGRLGKPDDITGLVRFLLSDEARFLTGQSIVVDGGLTC